MFCSKCGKQLSDDMLFCPGCGSKVVSDAPPQAAPSQPASNIPPQANPQQTVNTPPHQATPPQKVKKASKAPIIIVAVVVIVILWFVFPRFLHRVPAKLETSLAGTWIATFADGEAECRLHFDDDGDSGAAMLTRFDENGDCIGYFEVIYLGEVTHTEKDEGDGVTSGVISIKNVGDMENSDHAYELPYMLLQYTFYKETGRLVLETDFLSTIFREIAKSLTFTHVENDDYYADTGDRYYDWNLFLS